MSKKIRRLLDVLAILFGVVAIFMIFANHVEYSFVGQKTAFSGTEVVFGYAEDIAGGTYRIFGFSFLNLLTYVFLAVGIVLTGLKVFVKGFKSNLYVLISVLCFVLAGIFFLCVAQFANVKVELEFTLGVGAVLASVFSFVSAVLVALGFIK